MKLSLLDYKTSHKIIRKEEDHHKHLRPKSHLHNIYANNFGKTTQYIFADI